MNKQDELHDAYVRHQIGLLRVAGSIRVDTLELLDATEADLADTIRRRTRGGMSVLGTQRLAKLRDEIAAIRAKAWDAIDPMWKKGMQDLTESESQYLRAAIISVSPVVLELDLPETALLRSLITSLPFEGRTLRQWSRKVRQDDLNRIMTAIQIGVVQGENPNQLARRVVGTVGLRGTNGVTEVTRRAAAALTRTAVNHYANQAKRLFAVANRDILKEELYVATLDSRTTAVCRANDGKRFPVGEGPIPPLHFNCRSLRVPLLDGKVLGTRPFKQSTERALLERYAAAEGLPVVRTRNALPRGHKTSFDVWSRGEIRRQTGTLPAAVNYQQFLTRQSNSFQNDVLGTTRARLFRRGNLTLDRFVNRAGDEIPLRDLVKLERQAFIDAGLNPADF